MAVSMAKYGGRRRKSIFVMMLCILAAFLGLFALAVILGTGSRR